MKTIIIEQSIYKVSEKEFTVIKGLETKIKEAATLGGHKPYYEAEDNLNEYLDAVKQSYKFIGTVDFHCQR